MRIGDLVRFKHWIPPLHMYRYGLLIKYESSTATASILYQGRVYESKLNNVRELKAECYETK